MSIDQVRAIADQYRARVAAKLGVDVSVFDGPYRAPFETRPTITWCEPELVDELLADPDSGAVRIEPDDTKALAEAWPPMPATVPRLARAQLAEKWGPTSTRTVAVARMPL